MLATERVLAEEHLQHCPMFRLLPIWNPDTNRGIADRQDEHREVPETQKMQTERV